MIGWAEKAAQHLARLLMHTLWSNSLMFLELMRETSLNLELLQLEIIQLQNHRLLIFSRFIIMESWRTKSTAFSQSRITVH